MKPVTALILISRASIRDLPEKFRVLLLHPVNQWPAGHHQITSMDKCTLTSKWNKKSNAQDASILVPLSLFNKTKSCVYQVNVLTKKALSGSTDRRMAIQEKIGIYIWMSSNPANSMMSLNWEWNRQITTFNLMTILNPQNGSGICPNLNGKSRPICSSSPRAIIRILTEKLWQGVRQKAIPILEGKSTLK